MKTTRSAMDLLVVCTGILVVGLTLCIPGGNSVPSPLHNNHYEYDIAMDIDSYVHHRKPRLTGRGNSIDTWECDTVTAVPEDIRDDFFLDNFYQKYVHAYGIPIISSSNSRDDALRRACYTVRFLLADRRDVRDAMYDMYGRVGVIAQSEQTTDIPEHSHLSDNYDDRARGLGGIPSIPITTDGEENILCLGFPHDRWFTEDVLVHEFAHAIHLISMNRINSTFQQTLVDIYNQAKADNLWQNTYAISSNKEYFAEGVQGFFNVQTCRDFVDYIHNDICTREQLKDYDRRLYDLISEVFPCQNTIVDRCTPNQNVSAAKQTIRMNCDVRGVSTSPQPASTVASSTVLVVTASHSTKSVTGPSSTLSNDVTSRQTLTEIRASGALGTCCGYDHQILAWILLFVTCLIK